jgi:Hypothetical protein (DUF2513)
VRSLLAIESGQSLTFADHTAAEVGYQIELLCDVGYLEGKVLWDGIGETLVSVAYFVKRITMGGHDYLDSIRDPKVWNKTKSVLENVGGSAALEVVKDVAVKVMAELIKPFIGGA